MTSNEPIKRKRYHVVLIDNKTYKIMTWYGYDNLLDAKHSASDTRYAWRGQDVIVSIVDNHHGEFVEYGRAAEDVK